VVRLQLDNRQHAAGAVGVRCATGEYRRRYFVHEDASRTAAQQHVAGVELQRTTVGSMRSTKTS